MEKNTPDIVNIILEAGKGLINFANSLIKKEQVYNQFISKMLQDYSFQNKLDFTITQEERLDNKYRPDITIRTKQEKIFCEGKRLLHTQKGIGIRYIEQVSKYFLFTHNIAPMAFDYEKNIKKLFLLVYSETNDFWLTWTTYKNDFSSKKINSVEYNFRDVTKEFTSDNDFYIGETIIGEYSIIHIFINLAGEKQLNAEENIEPTTDNKITNLEIYNFKLFQNTFINVNPQVNVLLGKNGLGKTSFLQALSLVNLPDEYKNVEYKSFISIGSKEASMVLNRENENAITIQISNFGKTTDNSRGLREPFIFTYGTNIFTRYEYPESRFVDNLIAGSERDGWYFTESIFKEKCDSFYDPLRILSNISENLFGNKLLDFILKKLKHLIPKYRIIKQNHLFYFEDINQNLLKTEQLSEGYRNNILLLFDIILRVLFIRKTFSFYEESLSLEIVFEKAKGVIAIDEFDRHLHPTWQKVYIDNLVKLLPNVQFFLTTHNPVAILGRKEGEVQLFVYDESQKSIVVQPLPATENRDAGSILISHFGLDSVVSTSLQTKLNDYYDLKLNSENPDTQRIEQLKNELDSTWLGVNIHDYRFYIFLKFLKDNGYDFKERLEEITFSPEEIEQLKAEFEAYYSNLNL